MQGGQLQHPEPTEPIDTIEPNNYKPCKMHELADVVTSDGNQSPPQSITIQNCDNNLLHTQSTPINGDVNTHDDAKSVLINNRTKIGDENCSTEHSIVTEEPGDSGALTNINCDTSVLRQDSLSEVNAKVLPKPILNSNGRSAGTLSKKSVSFDTDDEKIKKFINGDVIVDKQNPFRSVNAKRREEFFRKSTDEKPVVIPPDEFVTTEDVLKESKYVKTYIKHPDLYFEYDPSLKARLEKEEAAEQRRNIPVRKAKFSRSTNERLKEIKSKFSPTTILYAQPKVFSSSSDEVDSRFLSRNRNRINDKRYPDISQIKVKTGTDLETSLFNPEEVALNALKFDARIKNSSFGSQDDLDDIADLTSTSVESVIENKSSEKSENESSVEHPAIEEDQSKQTFTNTVSSKEFQEFLKKKGLTLLPESRRLQQQSVESVNNSSLKIEETLDMETKKSKKPSVLQRLFPSRMFLSKRRTTPKEPVPEPKKLYTTLSDDEVNRTPGVKRVVLERQSYHAANSSDPTAYMKNLNYQKQMMDDGSSSISSALTNAESYVDMNVAVPVPRKRTENKENYIDMKAKWDDQHDGRNGTLDKEKYLQSSRKSDIGSSKSSLGVRYIDSSSSNNTIMCDTPEKQKPLPKARQTTNGRSSVPILSPSERLEYHRNNYNNSAIPIATKNRKEPVSFRYNNTPDTNDGIIKPRVQRVPLSVDTKLGNKILAESDGIEKQTNPPIPMKRNLERQSLNYKKPNNPESSYGNLNRTVSLDKNEIKKRNPPKPLERSKPVQSLAISQNISRNNIPTDKSPKTPSEIFLGIPQSTSTPLANAEQPQFQSAAKNVNGDFYFHKKPKTVSPIVDESQSQPGFPDKKLELDSYSWAKLRELKEQTDRQLYNKPLTIQTDSTTQLNNVYGRPATSKKENIYERLPHQAVLSTPLLNVQRQNSLPRRVMQPQHPKVIQLLPVRQQQPQQTPIVQQKFVRNSPQRNTVGNFYRNKEDKAIDGRTVDEFGFVQQEPNQAVQSPQLQANIQRPRCQSVLDNMTSRDMYGTIQSQNQGGSVILRKKPIGGMTREEIMSKVQEFCRKSMNNTPTKNLKGSVDQLSHRGGLMNRTSSSEISPVSYTSLDSRATHSIASSRSSAKLAPQVPQRVQSLQKENPYQSNSPIYAPINKRESIQSTNSDVFYTPVNKRVNTLPNVREQQRHLTYSDSDSVFLANDQNQTRVPINTLQSSQRILVLNGDQISPQQVIAYHTPVPSKGNPEEIYVSRPNDIYGRVHPQNNPIYGYIQRNPSTPSQIYYTTGNQKRVGMDGRATPLILHAIHHQPPVQQVQQVHMNGGQLNYGARGGSGSIVVLENVEPLYRPIGPKKLIPQSRPIRQNFVRSGNHIVAYESESCSEAEEVQRILQSRDREEDWQNDKGRNQQNEQVVDDRRRAGAGRREDPRRHTLGNDMLGYGQGQLPPQRAMDLEMGTRAQKTKKGQPIRGYQQVNQGPLFDDDPGIMSEVETASTGFRRGGKQRSSLPVVRTPSKTLERPLGLVFLQYRSETKRALLPNEITSIDTVRALFVRSFPRQLTMAYLEGPNVKIYIHDASKDMFYELEDVRSHLREIRDRSVLRLFESNEVTAPQVLPGGPGVPQPLPSNGGHWDQDQSYFSEPEFDSEYQHQHIHKGKGSKAPYYVGAAQTLPRGMYSDRNKNVVGAPAKPLRSGSRGGIGPSYPYPSDQLYSIPDGYMSSPERGTRGAYEEPYYSQYGTRGGSVTPIIDEEQSEISMNEDQYALYGHKVSGRIPRTANQMYDPTRPEDLHRIRVEHMERQLANLTGLVQKALTQNVPTGPPIVSMNQNYLGVNQYRGDEIDGHSSGSSTSIQANGIGDDIYVREKPPKLGKSSCHKSVSFEKSVSFSDDIQGVPKSHIPQHPERDRLKPPPPPKPLGLAPAHNNYRPDIALAPEVYNHLRGLQKKAKDLRMEMRTLRRLSQAQAVAVREDIKDAFMGIRATLMASSGSTWGGQGDQEKTRLSREEEMYKQEVIRLEKDLSDLESSVEGLRGEVINRRTRVNMTAVEDMALVLSRASKTVAELKMRFPSLQNGLRNILSNEMEKVVREEKFLKEEPDRLESALRRCKKLTGTLVTLKRLASVQEQRLPCAEPPSDDVPRSADLPATNKPVPSPRLGSVSVSGGIPHENALDALLDELQTFAKPPTGNTERPDDSTSDDSSQTLQSTVTTQLSQTSLYPTEPLSVPNIGLRRLHSYPSGSDTDTSPPQPQRSVGKPPVPERNAELLSKVSNKRIPPPPPPRTSSRSPLASPTSPNVPTRMPSLNESMNDQHNNGNGGDCGNSSGSESNHSQEHGQRQMALELRHQELLKKQKQLQEQYARLQQISKTSALPPADILHLKKTGSESNLPQKMGLNMAISGSMKNLNVDVSIVEAKKNEKNHMDSGNVTTTKQVYETDIL
ncbi:uncharacterized protein LOC119076436 isoform X4 [Bradysia coprophila]|uniref:uncharacterized protein LOC119076436 isoform X4 n=1 Tax=Bradysia coprophila TaxID=38358 RepID=UPI00187D7FBF|nr:uncharacterized protein LOC119076436 isoform X4 [Bradysia coprophila]